VKHLRELSSLAGGERSIPSRTSGIQFQCYDGLTEFAIKRGVASRVRVRLPKDETVLSVNSGAGKVMVYWIGSVLGPGEGVYWVLERECTGSGRGSVLGPGEGVYWVRERECTGSGRGSVLGPG